MRGQQPRSRSRGVSTVVGAIARIEIAALSGALLADAIHHSAAGDTGAAGARIAIGCLGTWWSTNATMLAAFDTVKDRRRIRRQAAAIRALRRKANGWRRQAIGWQAEAERAEAEAQTAMLHTPLGPTLTEISSLSDTRDRQR